MATKVNMVSLNELFDGYSGKSMAEVAQAVTHELTRAEMQRYLEASNKVARGKILNRKDLEVLDKIDALTFEQNSMCLKDSKFTKARIKACKKYGITFNDRDGLVEHMDMFIPASKERADVHALQVGVEESQSEGMGEDAAAILSYVLGKAMSDELLDLIDLQFLSEFEKIATEQLGFSMLTDELVAKVNTASKACGVYFKNLQTTIH